MRSRACGFGVALVFGEDVADYVCSFESDGELAAGTVVLGAGEERARRVLASRWR